MNSIVRFFNSLTTRLQLATLLASMVGIFFSYKSYLRSYDAAPEVTAALRFDMEMQLLMALIAQVLAWFIISQLVIKPFVTLIELMRDFGDNKFDAEIPYTTVANQIGSFARKVKIFKDRITYMRKLEEEQKSNEEMAQHERALLLQHIATEFDTNVSQIVVRFTQSTDSVKGNAQSLSGIAAQNASRLKTLLNHSEQAGVGLTRVAAAAQQLSGSIEQIKQQVENASHVSHSAVSKASDASEIMRALSDGAVKINAVLGIISQITSQINLLALNATIEAARAGEQGKGFAVVASEVKSLAGKTASSTKEIAEYIGYISQQTKHAVESIEEIQHTIKTMDAISSQVAGAVDDQSCATQDIARIIQSCVAMSAESSAIVDAVSQETQKMDTAAEEMLWSCTTLSTESTSLNIQAKDFLKSIKNS